MAGHHKITDHDHGYKALKKRLEAASIPVTGTVGIHEAEGAAADEDGTTVLDIATFMEFGTEHVPARSFVAAYADENVDTNRARMRKIGQAVVKGSMPSMAFGMDRLGLKIVAEMQARIRAGIDPEDAPATIAAKGSSTPLIDTGQLWTSIRHQVVVGGHGGGGHE